MKTSECIKNIEKCGSRVYRSKKARTVAKNVNRVGKLMKYAQKTWGGYPV